MQDTSALARVVDLVRDLRKRCPWDGAQTPETLRPYLVEEALELDHAIGSGLAPDIRDEVGDLLLHVAFQIVLGEERGDFGAEDVVRAVESKMWRRHPHLFPAAAPPHRTDETDMTDMTDETGAPRAAPHPRWERTKLAERAKDGPGVLDGLPPNLPALIMAYRLQERAAGVGFDWPDSDGPLAKVREELGELSEALQGTTAGDEGRPRTAERIEHEVGDVLFSVVNLARKLGCDPRAALEQANRRFLMRFRQVEVLAAERGVDVGRAQLDVLDQLWEEAKRSGR